MSKVFIDSNILISAIVFDKNELEVILRGIKAGDEIFISEHIIEEATRVILKKFPDYFELYENFLDTAEIKIIPKSEYSDSIKDIDDIRDKYDAHVVACAKKLKCDYIVSGDKDLLSYQDPQILIITSKEYLSIK